MAAISPLPSESGAGYRRSRSIPGRKPLTEDEWAARKALDEDAWLRRQFLKRPRTRGDCWDFDANQPKGPRPCPFVACRHNLYLDIHPGTGTLRLNFPQREPWEVVDSCALDVVAKQGECTLEQVGDLTAVTRERIRQIEGKLLGQMRVALLARGVEWDVPAERLQRRKRPPRLASDPDDDVLAGQEGL